MVKELQWAYSKAIGKDLLVFPKDFISQVQKILTTYSKDLSDWEGIANTKPTVNNTAIKFNGIDTNAYETFIFELTPNKRTGSCKTNGYPYTTAIIDILKLAQEYNIISSYIEKE